MKRGRFRRSVVGRIGERRQKSRGYRRGDGDETVLKFILPAGMSIIRP